MSDMRRSWRHATPKWQLVPVGVLAAVVSFLDFSTRLGASAACRALHAAAKTPTSVPTRLVVRAPRPCETRRRPPPALWSLRRLQTLRVARLVCFATADIAALQSLTQLRHLTATFDVRAAWRFPPALEALELVCAVDRDATQSYADVAPHSHASVFASLSALRALTLDASAAHYGLHLLPWPPNLASLDYAGPLVRVRLLRVARRPRRTDESSVHRPPGARRVPDTRDATRSAPTAPVDVWRNDSVGYRRRRRLVCGAPRADVRVGGRRRRRAATHGDRDCAHARAREAVRAKILGRVVARPRRARRQRWRRIPRTTALSVADARQFATLAGVDRLAATLRSLDVSGTAVRDASQLGLLTNLVRLHFDDVRPTTGKNVAFPAAPLPFVRRLSIRGSDHWRWTARHTFPDAEITPPLTNAETAPKSIASSLLLCLPVAST